MGVQSSGQLTKEKFQEIIEAAYPEADKEKLTNYVFGAFDVNGDGSINFKEFMIVTYCMANADNEEILKMIFRMFDENRDQHITRNELKVVVTDLFHLLSKDEVDPASASEETLAKMAFKEMDADGDEEI